MEIKKQGNKFKITRTEVREDEYEIDELETTYYRLLRKKKKLQEELTTVDDYIAKMKKTLDDERQDKGNPEE